jgi:hypothetical protein
VSAPLVRPLKREVLVAGTSDRLLLTADGLRLTPKGKRKSALELTWDELLALHAADSVNTAAPGGRTTGSPPPAILNEIAVDLKVATASLARADQTLALAGVLPAALQSHMASDPQYGPLEERSDWYIEPLLTMREVASVLRLSTRAVRRLPIRTILVAGEMRYRQSEIRHFLQKQESNLRTW